MSSLPKTFLTPEQYLEIERKAEFKSEYYNGEMFAMSGAKIAPQSDHRRTWAPSFASSFVRARAAWFRVISGFWWRRPACIPIRMWW